MNKWDAIGFVGSLLYFMVGGIMLIFIAADTCQQNKKSEPGYGDKLTLFFGVVFFLWPVVIYFDWKEKWQKRTYKRLKAKFEGK